MPSHHEITGEKHFECQICGFPYKESELGFNQAGLRVCFQHCMDDGPFVHSLAVAASGRVPGQP